MGSLNSIGQSEKKPNDVSSDWFQQAAKEVQNIENDFYAAADYSSFRVMNANNHLAFVVDKSGYSVHNTQYKPNQGVWSVDFKIMAIGREESRSTIDNNFVVIKKPLALTYSSRFADIQYINGDKGLRQNFIINEKHPGNEKLCITMHLNSSLEIDNRPDNKIVFHTRGNKNDTKLIYDDLEAWDAANNKLSAIMKFDNVSNSLTITVDDANAIYPVTIDPLNRTPEWTTSADGILPGLLTNLQLQVQTIYGYTVAALGDINGDGYDDVAVSAPGMADVITGTGSLSGVGAVFIYLGSSSGLPTAPSKILQPTTALNGALFGYSIDAGDITGDGKNDIVIGAPMDRYQTSAAGLLGPTNVNVTAGKVYLYRSEDMLNATNPSPFLEIKLQGTSFFSTGILGLSQSNVTTNPLFGFSVAVTKDVNGDNKADIIIGSPSYMSTQLLSVQNGAAFVYYSNNLNTISPQQMQTPTPSLLGLSSLPLANTNGLLFGFSVDGVGDYNGDGNTDIIVGAPAGVDLSSLGGIFSGQFLGGSAYIYYGNGAGLNSSIGTRLQASASGLLSNAANLFGYEVKGVRNATGTNTGNVLIGAPLGSVLSNVVNGLKVKAGQVHVFKKNSSGSTSAISDQIISSPRSTSILSILSGQTINVSLMYGASIDNMLDVNCDGIGDIIVGEPLSTAVPLIGADVVGGGAYVYIGKSDGTYNLTPIWDLTSIVSPLLGVNATALLGYSVAGAGHVKGHTQSVRSLVGGPSNTLDFGVGLLNLGNTLGTLFSFTYDNNGLGKSYAFSFPTCNIITLPVILIDFKAQQKQQTIELTWATTEEINFNHFEILRSADGANFKNIGTVKASGSTSGSKYNFVDATPLQGDNYYRLKIVDNDDQFKYSSIVLVKISNNENAGVSAWPNPVQNEYKIKMNRLEKGDYRIEVLNSMGQLQITKKITITGDHVETMNRSTMNSSGIYWLRIVNEKNNYTVKTIRLYMN